MLSECMSITSSKDTPQHPNFQCLEISKNNMVDTRTSEEWATLAKLTWFLLIDLGKSNPITDLDRPWGFQEAEATRFQDNRHMKVVRLSALRTGCLYPQEIFLVLISVKKLSQPQGHSGAGRIMSMKNSNDTIGNRTRDLPTCSAVPQPTALQAACPIGLGKERNASTKYFV